MFRRVGGALERAGAVLIVSTLAAAAAVIAGPASGQNLVTNPSFDADLLGWRLGIFDTSTIEWDITDVFGSLSSGSARVTKITTDGPNSVRLTQCVPALAGESYVASGWFRIPSQGSQGASWLAVDWYETNDCRSFIENGPVVFDSAPLDAWFQKRIPASVAPASTGGMLVLAGAVSTDPEVPYTLLVDEVFAPAPSAGVIGAAALASPPRVPSGLT